MEVTKKLMAEHQLILSYIRLIRTKAPVWKTSNSDRWKSELNTMVEFIRTYADQYHHAKEENILFRYMATPGVLNHCNPLPVMLQDHELGRNLVAEVLHGVDTDNQNLAIESIVAWADHLESHISKEDNVLYLMAEEGLHSDLRVKILQEYSQVEEHLNGIALESRFQLQLENLSNF